MQKKKARMKKNGYIRYALKTVLSLLVLAGIMLALFVDGVKPYSSYRDYDYQNDFSWDQANSLAEYDRISQSFLAKGNILDNVSLYLGDVNGEVVTISIFDELGNEIYRKEILTSEYTANSWNKFGIQGNILKRDSLYTISFESENGLGFLYCDQGYAPIIFRECFDQNATYPGAIAVGFQFTYEYLTLGSIFELVFKALVSVLIGLALCYSIFNIEKLVRAYTNTEKKRGFLYALYFSVSLVLLYNPIESVRTEMTEFGRVIGAGVAANVDVSKRVSNFSYWFLFLAISFALLYLLSNYWIQKKKSEQAKKVEAFLDNYMVLANCSLVLKCITYFHDETAATAVYSFSSCVILLISIVAIAYIVLRLDEKVTSEEYAKLLMIGASLSYPIAMLTGAQWSSGRVLIGVLFILSAVIIFVCEWGYPLFKKKSYKSASDAVVIVLALIPTMISFYIESVHVLNQHEIFVGYPAKNFKIVFAAAIFIAAAVAVCFIKRRISIKNWKGWAFPWFVFGAALLSIQIPISSTYNPSIFEDANYSILISDFLEYGRIPIVEHYGGHMMTSVWEGLLYAFVNQDAAGAVLSPYAALFTPVLAVFFYYFVKHIWDEKTALFVALLFPFMGSWSYFGLGMLVCIAAMAYVKKNSYFRAAMLWAACIWCALYRLDLGFAYGIAAVISLLIYAAATRNRRAWKELGLTLIGWGIVGGGAWFIICLVKGINPINRLIEFLMVSLSNQSWAYSNIGNTADTLFGWSYLFIPFLTVICLLYTVFSKNMRARIGNEKWMLLLILGLAYFGNFSRGLVRHSLYETAMTVVIWTGYLFLAAFFSCFKSEKRLFLPVFMLFVLCNTLFVQDENFREAAIADDAVSQPASIIESWKPGRFDVEEYERLKLEQDTILADGGDISDEDRLPDEFMTYWEQLKFDREVVERVELNEDMEKYVAKFDLLNLLLDEDETFVDFINKTLLYSLMGRENPVYVSQSPLQLSGEFTQLEFIKEISEVPIVLMPLDSDNFGVSNSLDGMTNAYKNYKVAEYIFQKYRPLCQYESAYAIWCLKDRYDEYIQKLSSVVRETEYVDHLLGSEEIGLSNAALSPYGGGVCVSHTGTAPMLTELQEVMDLSPYVNKDVKIVVEYETDIAGPMQLFYTEDSEEDYNEEKAVTVEIADKGSASFVIPVTEDTRLRLDIPEESSVKIKSLLVKEPVEPVDFGYDGPTGIEDENGSLSYRYISALHNHNLNQLPRIWAETDKKNSAANNVVCDLYYNDNVYTFDQGSFEKGENGNYLKISAVYDGTDTGGLYQNDDEKIDAVIILGLYENGRFAEKCRYGMSFMEGQHDYLIRCSTDYYWYLNEINAVKIQSDGTLHDVEMKILEGD